MLVGILTYIVSHAVLTALDFDALGATIWSIVITAAVVI